MRKSLYVLAMIVSSLLLGAAQTDTTQTSSSQSSSMQNDDTERGQVGIFSEYFRFQGIRANIAGLGGRLSFNVHKNIQLEGEMSYLFRRGFAEDFSNGVPGFFTTSKSSVRAFNALFGPKLLMSKRPVRPSVVLKGGFLNTEFSDQSPGPGFISQINNFRRASTNGVFYPGAGLEGNIGFLGLRFDIGDEIVFNRRKANHNLRMTFGPQIRF
ncbi:MAG TPA: hypothetical protein VM056_06545 [Terriglobales bacterium]|nr:hypothetical protein [Terriglobales bacterium]